MSGLKIWTFCLAIWARRSRRMSSSLLPLNMLPVMTSIQPCSGALRTISIYGLDAALVFPGFGVDPDLVAFVDEGRHVHDQAGFEGRRLHLRARRRALDAGHRVLHDQVDHWRQLDADRFDIVELDANRHLGNEIVLRVAQRFGRDVNLLV